MEDDVLVPLSEKEGRLARIITPGLDISEGLTRRAYEYLKKQERQILELYGVTTSQT